ncbi:MAG: tRNA-dihydrouridine synthase [Microbacterium sp.]|nr:tRNA-dihydrouridine synthase [Microbacterium sp.]
MIMGASIASVAWIAFVPWSKLRRLKELDAEREDGSA